MKSKLMALIALVWMMLPGTASAEYVSNTLPQFWTVPAIYAFDEEVTWYFDVSGLGFEEGLDLYLWAWEPSEPDAGNRDNTSPNWSTWEKVSTKRHSYLPCTSTATLLNSTISRASGCN